MFYIPIIRDRYGLDVGSVFTSKEDAEKKPIHWAHNKADVSIVAIIESEDRRELGPLVRLKLRELKERNFFTRSGLGSNMALWHCGMLDPIYMVASFYIADEVYPQKEIVEKAIVGLEKELSFSIEKAHQNSADINNLKDILFNLQHFYAIDYRGEK